MYFRYFESVGAKVLEYYKIEDYMFCRYVDKCVVRVSYLLRSKLWFMHKLRLIHCNISYKYFYRTSLTCT